MTKLTEIQRGNLIIDANAGCSLSNLAKKYEISKTRVRQIKTMANITTNCLNNGRPRLLTSRDDRVISRKIKAGHANTAMDVLKNNHSLAVSPQTIRRSLQRQGLKAAPKKKRPFLSKRHKRSRFEFAEAHRHWTIDDWRQVVFSDESKINRLWSDGRKWCWKTPGEPLNDRNVQCTLKFGGGSIMVWSCITSEGPGYITKINNKLDATLYCDILRGELIDSCHYYGLDLGNIIFQHDNDPKHTSKKAKKCLIDNSIRVLPWPAQSPDLNPIEHMWSKLKIKLNQYESLPSGILELWDRVSYEWNKFSKQDCLDLIDSMPRRVQAVLRCKGGYTKY